MPEPDEDLLPAHDERRRLVEDLASLVRARGFEHLALAPLVEPDTRFFPDRWQGGEASVRRVVRRLCIYADLESLAIDVTVHEDLGLGPIAPHGPGATAWLESLERGTARFGARASALRDPKLLVPALARAVAEVFRDVHRLTVRDAADEQRSIDVTTVFLGFGILTTEACIRHGGSARNHVPMRLGVLAPDAFSWLLATQVTARGCDAATRRAIAKRLPANQAAFFAAGCAALEGGDATLLATLDLPPRETWPDPPSLSILAGPLPDDEGAEPNAEVRRDEDRGIRGANAGRAVFRVERSKSARLAKQLGLPVVLGGMLLARMNLGVDIQMWEFFLAGGALAALGLGIGRFLPDARCSEPKCGTTLRADATECPLCGGTIAGVINHPRERLAAEEALARESPREPER